MTLPVSLKKAFDKAHKAFEKDWKYHLKVCEHECKDTEKQKDLFGVGYFCSSLSSRGVFASFLETARKELQDFCDELRTSNQLWVQPEDETLGQIQHKIDAVFGGERK